MLMYEIEEGKNHYKGIEIYRVIGTNNEYIGEWSYHKLDCKKELQNLKKRI
jgi:hypothetical protein